MVQCCKCNKTSKCSKCVCVKAGRRCSNCLPSRLGICVNCSVDSPSPSHDPENSSLQSVPISATPSTRGTDSPMAGTTVTRTENRAYQDFTRPGGGYRTGTSFPPLAPLSSTWGGISGAEFSSMIDGAYNELVHWTPNLFQIPSGTYVGELTRLFIALAMESDFEAIALKAAMTMPTLLLQKPHTKSKTHEHVQCLKCRLELWENRDIPSLLKEGRALQKAKKRSQPPRSSPAASDPARVFSRMMMEGRVRAAMRLLMDNEGARPLNLDTPIDDAKTVRDVLQDKHPGPLPAHPEILLEDMGDNSFHPVIFEVITGDSIRKAALHTQGAAGPSELHAYSWRRLCTAFGQKPNDLCTSVALVAQRISTSFVDPYALQTYINCRLIPLDKHPGVRPIGVGEVMRRIIGMAVMKLVNMTYKMQLAPSNFALDRMQGVRLLSMP